MIAANYCPYRTGFFLTLVDLLVVDDGVFGGIAIGFDGFGFLGAFKCFSLKNKVGSITGLSSKVFMLCRSTHIVTCNCVI